MRISIVGTRGIPAAYGGFETFAEEISVLLALKGVDICVQCDFNSYPADEYKGVKLYFSSVTKTAYPLKYYFEGIRWGLNYSDIILVASSAGSVFYFMNLFKKKIIITNPDGLEYKRKKWSFLKKLYLKVSEVLAVRLSDYIIADSYSIRGYLCRIYSSANYKTRIIEYGAFPNNRQDLKYLEKLGLRHECYYLIVCRLEPENNIEMILEGYKRSATIHPIVIVGNITGNRYVKRLRTRYESGRIRFVGGIYDKNKLNALRFSCKAYIHGHSVGGTNPSLLCAMANHNLIIAHDNIFNREVTEGNQLYFSNLKQCSDRINEAERMTVDQANKLKKESFRMIINKYNWENILAKYLDLFREISEKQL